MSETITAEIPAPKPNDLAIGIDIGGTGMKGGVVDTRTGNLVGERFRIPTPQPATPEACATVIREIVDELQGRELAPAPDSAIGIDFPAVVKNGVTLSAANVDETWIGADLEGIMSAALDGRKVYALNDADAAGLAEAIYGQGRDKPGLIAVITLGTGIGSALIINGQLVPNTELGHLEIDGHDAETQASARARETHELSWKKYGKRLHRYFTHVEMLFTPDLFIIGGGISKNPEKFLPYIEEDVRTPIVMAELRNNAGIVGAAVWAAGMPSEQARRAA
ncbi:polyphosphate--glucose phosphotransferase [Rothia sp. (in: high G+C Gram-positive bacteria)]|uniref:polyphosphate--glucose phosphotransferase n=1 Tax=Rothia sp. (in: high G+C Gram-positive bacteria) TaxID=1885016 RepID=UPI000EDED4B1|nr:polyphosphate glucokinase [Rothia sp. (in: high G+C Gram-positive bacteria)]